MAKRKVTKRKVKSTKASRARAKLKRQGGVATLL